MLVCLWQKSLHVGQLTRGGHSETKLVYGNDFHTLNGAQNIVPLIDVNGAHFSKHTLNRREWRPFLETYPYLMGMASTLKPYP